MPGAIEGAVFAALISNAVTFPLAGSALAISAISSAVTAGLYAGASLLLFGGGRRRDVSRPDQAKQTVQIPDAPIMVCLGRAPMEGSLLYSNAIRQGSDNNLLRHLAMCAGPIDAFEEYQIGDRPVVVESDGTVSSPPYARVGTNYARLYARFGNNPETAFSQLIAAFPDLYDASHRGDALAQMLGVFTAPSAEEYLKIFPNGKPNFGATIRGIRDIYDPRTDSHGWTDNGPLNVLWFLTAPPWLGWGLPAGIFDMDDIAQTADAADAEIALKEGGTEKRSRCSGVYSCDRPRGEILADLLLSTGVRFVRLQNGKFSLRLQDDDPTPELVIPADDVEEFDWAVGPESVERPNRMALKIFPPEQNYNVTELSLAGLRWGEDQAEIDRVGPRLDEVTFNFCQWAGQASRLGRILWHVRRAQRGQIITNLYGLGALGRTYATIPFIGTTRTIRGTMVQPRLEEDGLRVSIPFIQFPELPPYDPALDQADKPDQLPDAAFSGNIAKPAAPTEAAQIAYPGGAREVRLRYAAAPSGLSLEAVYQSYTGGNPNPIQSMVENPTLAYAAANLEGQRVDFKIRHFDPGEGEVSLFSDVLPADPLTISNATPAAPSMVRVQDNDPADSGLNAIVHVDTTQLRVASVVFERHNGTSWSVEATANLRPGQPFVYAFEHIPQDLNEQFIQYRAKVRTSNLTESAYITGSFTVPGSGGP